VALDDDEILPSTTLDAERDMILHHFSTAIAKVAPEIWTDISA